MEGRCMYLDGWQNSCSSTLKETDQVLDIDYVLQSVSANMCNNVDFNELDDILQLDGSVSYNRNSNNINIQNLDVLKTTAQTESLCDLSKNCSNYSQNLFNDNCNEISDSIPLRQQTNVNQSNVLFASVTQQTVEQEMLPISINIKIEESAVSVPTYLQNIPLDQPKLQSINFTLKEEKKDDTDFTLHPCTDEISSITPFMQILENIFQNEDILQETLHRDLSLIPSSIIALYDIICRRFSDFAFVYTLSAQMCKDLLPMHSFVNLKMSLLLSIASIGKNENAMPLPILAIGPDSSLISLVMNTLGNAAKRFVTILDDFQCGSLINNNFIEAGPILLAKDGVCYLGDWSRLKHLNNNKILNDIERGSVIIDGTSVCYRIRSAVWAYITLYHNKKDIATFSTLFEIFGIPVIVEDTCEELLTDFLLVQSCGSTVISQPSEFYIPLEDIKIYLEVVSKRKIDISGHANELLQKYFIAVRVDRPDCLPQRAFRYLCQISESFAKLAFRNTVLPIDVISAIYFAEHFINSSFGSGICPSPILISKKFIGDIDNFIKEFGNWLRDYIDRYATDKN